MILKSLWLRTVEPRGNLRRAFRYYSWRESSLWCQTRLRCDRYKNTTLPESVQLNEPRRRPAWLPLYIIRARWGRAALTASTVGMGDCQAAAKYTQGSVSGSSSALSEQRFRFSDNEKKKNRRGFVLAEVKWQLWQGRGRGLGTSANVSEDLTCRRVIGTIDDGGGGSCHGGPQISSRKDWGCPARGLCVFYGNTTKNICFTQSWKSNIGALWRILSQYTAKRRVLSTYKDPLKCIKRMFIRQQPHYYKSLMLQSILNVEKCL